MRNHSSALLNSESISKMMKQTFVVLVLIGFAFSAPQPRKLFSDHFQDFLDLIGEESGHEIVLLLDQYMQYEEFQATLSYMEGTNFRDLVYEMEALPEFNAVVDFLENDNIDIHTFIDLLNEVLGGIRKARRSSRQTTSGTTFSAFIYDCIAVFPKEKLAALFEEKIANDEEFSTAINNLNSEEWQQISAALWENETFQKEVESLREKGVEVDVLFDELMAIFGQD